MIALNAGDSIRGDASVASKVDYVLSGIVGVEVTHLASGQLASSEGNLFTAQAVGGAVTAICLVNTDSSARTLNIYHQPKGGTSRRIIPKDISLAAGYCLYANGVEIKVLDTSGNEQMSAIALDDTPVDGETQEAITSNWAYDHNLAKTAVHSAGAYNLLNTSDLEGSPTEDLATKAPTSEWAFDHNAKTTGTHGVTGTIVGTEDLDDVTQNDVTGSRAIDGTVFQNTSGKIKLVTITINTVSTNDEYYAIAYCDSNASPSTVITACSGETYNAQEAYNSMTFVVAPSYYYKVTETGDAVLYKWFEWDLF